MGNAIAHTPPQFQPLLPTHQDACLWGVDWCIEHGECRQRRPPRATVVQISAEYECPRRRCVLRATSHDHTSSRFDQEGLLLKHLAMPMCVLRSQCLQMVG